MIDIDYHYRFIDQRRLEKRGNKQTNKKYQSIVGTFVAVELYRDYSLHFGLKKEKFSNTVIGRSLGRPRLNMKRDQRKCQQAFRIIRAFDWRK